LHPADYLAADNYCIGFHISILSIDIRRDKCRSRWVRPNCRRYGVDIVSDIGKMRLWNRSRQVNMCQRERRQLSSVALPAASGNCADLVSWMRYDSMTGRGL
jgi:hypothetical protein